MMMSYDVSYEKCLVCPHDDEIFMLEHDHIGFTIILTPDLHVCVCVYVLHLCLTCLIWLREGVVVIC